MSQEKIINGQIHRRAFRGSMCSDTALAVLAIVGLIIIIRKGGGTALAAAAPAVALGVVRARTKEIAGAQRKEPIDMDFLKAQLRQGASEKVVVTPSELKIVLNSFFEEKICLRRSARNSRWRKFSHLWASIRRSERCQGDRNGGGMTSLRMEPMKLQRSKRQQDQDARQRLVREALGLVRSGQSVAEVAQKIGLHRLAIERGLREGFDRQHVIRQHLHARAGLTSLSTLS